MPVGCYFSTFNTRSPRTILTTVSTTRLICDGTCRGRSHFAVEDAEVSIVARGVLALKFDPLNSLGYRECGTGHVCSWHFFPTKSCRHLRLAFEFHLSQHCLNRMLLTVSAASPVEAWWCTMWPFLCKEANASDPKSTDAMGPTKD